GPEGRRGAHGGRGARRHALRPAQVPAPGHAAGADPPARRAHGADAAAPGPGRVGGRPPVRLLSRALRNHQRAPPRRGRGRGGARETKALMLLGPALAVAAVLFVIGVAGVLVRRNAIIIFMCVELMLNAVNLTFVAFAQTLGIAGQIFVFFVMAVAAAEAAVGLAIVLAIYRHKATVDLRNINILKG